MVGSPHCFWGDVARQHTITKDHAQEAAHDGDQERMRAKGRDVVSLVVSSTHPY